MRGRTPTHRFDYLFEPLDGDDIGEDNYEDEPIVTHGAHRRRTATPSKVVLGVIAVAAAAGTTATIMLVMRPDTVEPASSITSDVAPRQAPPALFPQTQPAAVTPAQAPVAPIPAVAPPVPPAAEAPAPAPPPVATRAPAPQQPVTTAIVADPDLVEALEPPPPPPAQPRLAPGAEMTLLAPTPATRSPMSVEPEPRQAFPDQVPPEGGDRRGGLLGGGGLL